MSKDRFLGNADIVQLVGCFYYLLSPLAVFTVIFIEMAREKANNLRKGLQVLGLGSCAWWCHWGLTGAIFSALSILVMQFASMIVGF